MNHVFSSEYGIRFLSIPDSPVLSGIEFWDLETIDYRLKPVVENLVTPQSFQESISSVCSPRRLVMEKAWRRRKFSYETGSGLTCPGEM